MLAQDINTNAINSSLRIQLKATFMLFTRAVLGGFVTFGRDNQEIQRLRIARDGGQSEATSASESVATFALDDGASYFRGECCP